MRTFHLTIAALDKIFVQDDVTAVYFQTARGEVGVLANHITYLIDTLPGQMRYVKADNTINTLTLTNSGIFFIQNNKARLWITT